MKTFWVCRLTILLMIAITSGCRDTKLHANQRDEPPELVEIRELSAPIAKVTSATVTTTAHDLRPGASRVARLYLNALQRFDGIYADGVGPAKRMEPYLTCKAQFTGVLRRIAPTPDVRPDAEDRRMWSVLRACRTMATRLSSLSEIATFGLDLKDITEAAMLTLSYAVSASGSTLGHKIHADAVSKVNVKSALREPYGANISEHRFCRSETTSLSAFMASFSARNSAGGVSIPA